VSSEWARYYDASGEEPRATLLFALDRFEVPGAAVDLGCGTGRDTVELVRRGWSVVAIDGEAEAIERLHARGLPADRVTTRVAHYEDARWEETDLLNASFSLPFCEPRHFADLWKRIVASLRPDGRFCGHLFGDRDGWAGDPQMTFHTRAEVDRLLAGLDVELLDEVEEDGKTAIGDPKHWHTYDVVARCQAP